MDGTEKDVNPLAEEIELKASDRTEWPIVHKAKVLKHVL